ncbi:CinA family protein [Desulfonatronum thioautotrophicum]|uniref:CinA family protein n=1 Tax=Desulfonatronum thioautotrophicum TaxID=617001 RepID=UPI0005EBE318|nr:CinA family protein [Desulfonatronum thioautotrophicum]
MKTTGRQETTECISALGTALSDRMALLATAESCTGGLIAHEATNVPGSSRWFAGGVVAYSNRIKQDVLEVPENVLSAHGAVSRETVLAMVQGVRKLLGTQAALAVSGIAGPDGGTPEKPVGTVWIAWALDETLHSDLYRFSGTRLEIKQQAAATALEGMVALLQHHATNRF